MAKAGGSRRDRQEWAMSMMVDPACNDVGNEVLSCYPEADTQIIQDVWSKFIWNPNYPTFRGSGYVDIYAYSAGSEEAVASWQNISNTRGSIGIQADDTWLPTETTWTAGQNTTHSYYFVIGTQGVTSANALTHQTTFQMIQTAAPSTLASALAASSSAVSAAAALSSASASLDSVLSSLSAEGLLTLGSSTSSDGSVVLTDSNGSIISRTATDSDGQPRHSPSNLQANSTGGNGLPKWAIAVISVLGFLTLLSAIVAAWVVLRHLRKRRQTQYAQTDGDGSMGGTSNTTTPMMAQVGDPGTRASSTEVPGTTMSNATGSGNGSASGGSGALAGLGLGALGRRSKSPLGSTNLRDEEKASHTDADADSSFQERRNTDADLLAEKPSSRSLASAIAPKDAAIISDAFRNVLRKPDFPMHHNGNSGSSGEDGDNTNTAMQTKAEPSPSSLNTAAPTAVHTEHEGQAQALSRGSSVHSSSEEGYGAKESDVEDGGKEADELMKSELASEGTRMRSIPERKRPDIRH